MTEIEYTFDSPDDARSYLREVGLLWAAWVVGLFLVLFTRGFTVLIVAVALFTALLIFARPLLPRTERLVPENKREGGAIETAFRGGTTRDRVLRELAYGVAPMASALETAGLSPRWIVVRHIVIALTLLALVFVLVVPLA
jgi:hypothetical protein